MPHLEVTAIVSAEADQLWQEVGAFQSIGRWHPLLDVVEGDGERPGCHRTTRSGVGEQVERLLETDRMRRCYRYAVESGPLPVADHVGELRVRAHDGGGAVVSWINDFVVAPGEEEDTVLDLLRPVVTAGVDALRQRYGD